jgi:carbonic anhydrase
MTMKKNINIFDKNYCNCGQSHFFKRRDFLKTLLPGALAFAVLQPTSSAQAATQQATALVLSCIDFRFLSKESHFLAMKKLANQYDWTALAGASLALDGFPHKADAQAFYDQLDLSYKLHNISKVIIIDHQDCGAYASKIDSNLSKNPQLELEVHTKYLNRAYQLIRRHYPNIDVELYFATLKNDEVKSILPHIE